MKGHSLISMFQEVFGLLNKNPDSIPKGPLTVREIIAPESVIVKADQHDAFPAMLAAVG